MMFSSGGSQPGARDSAEVRFQQRRVDHRDAAELLRMFYKEQVGRYGFAESVALDPDNFDVPNGIFVVIYSGCTPVGCGGARWFNPANGTVEIKKTYLTPEARGYGLGRELLRWLEEQAVRWGGRRSILETGVRNTAALELFTDSGYTPMNSYVAGRDPAINRAFVKNLAPLLRNDRDPQRANS